MVYFSNNAWNTMLSVTGVMVLPAYFMSTAYLWKIVENGEYPTNINIGRSSALITSILGCIYALWLIYAAGLTYLLIAVVFFTIGIPIFLWTQKQNNQNNQKIATYEKVIMFILILISIFAIYALTRGIVKI